MELWHLGVRNYHFMLKMQIHNYTSQDQVSLASKFDTHAN